ncbi:MAG: OmpH family outer membrane protein [Deltaproteobacteria bacterium]
MKKYGLLISGLFVILAILLSGSQVVAAEKTGFVDVREVMMKSDAGKKASDDFKKLYEKDRTKIQEKEAELKKLKDALEKQRAILTEAAMKDKETAYQKIFRDYQLLLKDSNEELQAREQEISKKLIPEILKMVHAIGERDKYTLIIEVGTVLYYAKGNDLTARVTEELNKTYKQK